MFLCVCIYTFLCVCIYTKFALLDEALKDEFEQLSANNMQCHASLIGCDRELRRAATHCITLQQVQHTATHIAQPSATTECQKFLAYFFLHAPSLGTLLLALRYIFLLTLVFFLHSSPFGTPIYISFCTDLLLALIFFWYSH